MSEQNSLGTITHANSNRPTDYLYRISIKCLIQNNDDEVLVVKENGRGWWDLPGGGMDHGENIWAAIAREMNEEVQLTGDFSYKILEVEEPAYLKAHNFWQLRLIFKVTPSVMKFSPGKDADQIAFMQPDVFKNSAIKTERLIYDYTHIR